MCFGFDVISISVLSVLSALLAQQVISSHEQNSEVGTKTNNTCQNILRSEVLMKKKDEETKEKKKNRVNLLGKLCKTMTNYYLFQMYNL